MNAVEIVTSPTRSKAERLVSSPVSYMFDYSVFVQTVRGIEDLHRDYFSLHLKERNKQFPEWLIDGIKATEDVLSQKSPSLMLRKLEEPYIRFALTMFSQSQVV